MIEENPPLPGAWLLLPLLIAAALYGIGLTSTDLWTPDEPRYAEVAREMVLRGDYIHPHCNGKPYAEKPPLFFWAVVAASRLTGGVDTLAVRLPSVLSALGTLVLLILLVEELFGRRAALIGGCMLATAPEFFWLARSGHIDMLLTLLITASLFGFWRWYSQGGWAWLVVFYGFMGPAVLAKGPVGMALPVLVVVCFLLARGEARKLWKMAPHIGLPAAAGIVLLWYIPAMRDMPELRPAVVIGRQVADRMFKGVSHRVNLFYYPFFQVVSLAWGMAPWSVPALFAAVPAWRSRREPGVMFLLCWAAVIFGFFTLIASKREIYILPMYPAAAGLAAAWVVRTPAHRGLNRIRVAVAGYGVFLLLLAVVAFVAAPAYLARAFPTVAPHFNRALLLPGALVGLAAMGVGLLAKTRSRLLAGGVAVCAAGLTFLAAVVLPYVNEYKSPRDICSLYNQLKRPGSMIAMYGRPREEYVFYTSPPLRSIRSPEELRDYFATPRRVFCLMKEPDYRAISEGFNFPLHIIRRERVSSRIMLLASNQAVPGHTDLPGCLLVHSGAPQRGR